MRSLAALCAVLISMTVAGGCSSIPSEPSRADNSSRQIESVGTIESSALVEVDEPTVVVIAPTFASEPPIATIEPTEAPAPESEYPLAPEFDSPTWLNSEPLRLAELRGKVVIVDFWAFG